MLKLPNIVLMSYYLISMYTYNVVWVNKSGIIKGWMVKLQIIGYPKRTDILKQLVTALNKPN